MAHLRIPLNSRAEMASSAAVNITGDLDLRVRVALDDWVQGFGQSVLSKFSTTTATRPYLLQVDIAGQLKMLWSDGTTLFEKVATVAPTVSDGETLWIRATLDVDNGAAGHDVKFYTGGSGETPTWVQLGSTVTTAGTTSIVSAPSVPIQIGVDRNTVNDAVGDYYRAQIYDGIDGTPVFDADPSDPNTWAPDRQSFVEKANGATVTLQGDAALVGAPLAQGAPGSALMLGI